jgi:hypothetical protein
MGGGLPTWTTRLEPQFNFYASPRVLSLLRGARRPALLAGASLWWPEVTRSAGHRLGFCLYSVVLVGLLRHFLIWFLNKLVNSISTFAGI